MTNVQRSCTILFAAFLLYSFYLPRYYIGLFNDDVGYIVGAESLGQGRYVNLADPSSPPINKFGVGYPLFLFPFVKICAPHWNGLKWTTVGLTLGSLLVFWRIACLFLSAEMALAALSVLAFNPTFAVYSGVVLSDPCFVFFELSSFLLLARALKRPTDKGLLLGLAIGGACLIRPVGVLIAAAILLALFVARRWKLFWTTALLCTTLWGGQCLRNYLLTRTSNAYFSFWSDSLPYLANVHHLADNVNKVLNTFFVYSLMGIDLPYKPWAIALTFALSAFFLGCVGRGAYHSLKAKRDQSTVAFAIVLFGLFYLLLQLLWTAVLDRYALPILPLIILFSLVGLTRAGRVRWDILLVVTLLGTGATRHIRELTQSWSKARPPEETRPDQSLQWIREHTSEDAIILGKPLIYLETGRRGFQGFYVRNPDELRYRLLQRSVSYVFDQPTLTLSVNGAQALNEGDAWLHTYYWPPHWAAAFHPLYHNEKEGTAIFEVVKDPSFERAFEHYQKAHADLVQGSTQQGMAELNAALAANPDLACAWDALGVTLWLQKNDLKGAQQKMEQAIHLRPCYPDALFHLSKIRFLQGDVRQARMYLDAAETAAVTLKEADWIDIIRRERISMKLDSRPSGEN